MASVWAVGDVHGESAMLEALLAALPRGEEDYTVFLGDYIDRGPDSRAVVERALSEREAAPERTVLLWGNHEDMAAGYYHLPAPSGFDYDPQDWFHNGGKEALISYEVPYQQRATAPCPDGLMRLFPLLKTFWRPPADLFPALSSHIFVHAGVLPGQQPEDAPGEILLWVREDFLGTVDPSGRVVVHGHTPFRQVRALPDKIGIDTGAVFGGVLTALQLPEHRVYQADREGRVIKFEI